VGLGRKPKIWWGAGRPSFALSGSLGTRSGYQLSLQVGSADTQGWDLGDLALRGQVAAVSGPCSFWFVGGGWGGGTLRAYLPLPLLHAL
jgi:hypothetical protein